MNLDQIYSAPPILKGIAQSAGYRSRCFDFNLEFYRFCNNDLDLFGKLQNYFILVDIDLTIDERAIIDRFLDHVVNVVIQCNSRYIGFSVFSQYTQKITAQLLYKFKNIGITDRIVLGGRGLSTQGGTGALSYLQATEQEAEQEFYEILKNRNLVNHVILGSGEEAVIDFLKTGISNPQQHNLDKMPYHWPDYEDYNFDNYLWVNDIPALDVLGSSGCVRNCDFCDVQKQFGKYKFLPGKDLANLMIHHQQKYKINKFIMVDSLVNGGLKHFQEFTKCMSEYNANSTTPIIWTGSYICRDLQHLKNINDYYVTLKSSGAEGLTIGAESGSNNVLDAMDKKSSVEALFFELEKFRQHKITCNLLTFCGHWSETHDDFVKSCDMLVKFIPYVRSGTISSISLGSISKTISGTPAANNINIITQPANGDIWIARNNRGNTAKVRNQRRLILSKLAYLLDLGVALEESRRLQNHAETIANHYDAFDEFFTKHCQDSSQFDVIENCDSFISIIMNQKQTLDMQIKLSGNACNGSPHAVISFNDNIVYQGLIDHDFDSLNFSIATNKLKLTGNIFSISLTNKNHNDTIVSQSGDIVQDKNVIIQNLYMDNCDLIDDVDFFHKNFYFIDSNNQRHPAAAGVWANGSLELEFDLPFIKWYSTTSTKNKSNSRIEQSNAQTAGLCSLKDYFEIFSERIKKLKI